MATTLSASIEDNLIASLGLAKLPEEKKQQMLATMTDLIQKRIFTRLLESLSEADKANVEEAGKSPEAFSAFLSQKMPNLPEVIDEEIQSFRTELLTSVSAQTKANE